VAYASSSRRTPLGRFGKPEDISEAVAWLPRFVLQYPGELQFLHPSLLTSASWLTGQVVYVDGGFLAAGLPYLEGLARPTESAARLGLGYFSGYSRVISHRPRG
jgi:hypothetical protein